MKRWTRGLNAISLWTLRHKWQYRFLYSSLIAFLVYRPFTGDWHWWDYLSTSASVFLFAAIAFLWWRMDVLDEFAEHTRAAVGSDANIMILTARLQLRTSSVRRLNRVMRRYDIMNVSPLDLPPEAKELREILESVRTK